MVVGSLIGVAMLALSCIAFFVMSVAITGSRDKDDRILLIAISFGMGPLFLSWVFCAVSLLLEGVEWWVVNFAVSGLLASIVFIGRREIIGYAPKLAEVLAASPFLIGSGVLLGVFTLVVFILPYAQNDPLEYATVARHVFETNSFRNYPATDTSVGNIYAPWTHPPAFVGLIVWVQSLVGGFDQAGISRLIAPYFGLSSVVILLAVGGWWVGGLASLILLSTYWYGHAIVSAHLDPLRIFAITCAVIYGSHIGDARRAVYAGILCGLALYSHSTGILAVGAAFLVWTASENKPNIRRVAMFGIAAVAVVAPWWVRNYQRLGSILTDSQLVWNLPNLDFSELQRRERGLLDASDQVWLGVLRGFSDTTGFGPWYYLALAGAILTGIMLLVRPVDVHKKLKLALVSSGIALVFWFSFASLVTALGSDAAIRNARYALTFQPMVALFVAAWSCPQKTGHAQV
ncbi:hypothetical protein ASC97_07730 [Rhizobium sp. Root1203]|uniref:hypothetical protein n=1 Tax=Rhizobium sp. Root1203 TaxID=1736427 RepID=UPI00070FB3F2|nr:hypothetical protein [Rhizobium sp. Root1203]KQV28220.1 hypothetical protein ASC97_07730 [Rhizobium sp. Root1203]